MLVLRPRRADEGGTTTGGLVEWIWRFRSSSVGYDEMTGVPMTKTYKRSHILLKTTTAVAQPSRKPMPVERETPNPAPEKDYSRKRPPFTDDEENDPEIEDE